MSAPHIAWYNIIVKEIGLQSIVQSLAVYVASIWMMYGHITFSMLIGYLNQQ